MSDFENRRPGLIGCGIVYLLFGVTLAGFCALMLATLFIDTAPKQAMPPGMLIYVSVFYLGVATIFATLGMGSILARRWAPPLIQAISWAWLFGGVGTLIMLGTVMPRMMATLPRTQAPPPAFVYGCMGVAFGIFGVAVPIAFLLFYRSPHVKATVESLDPVPRWTDRHPVPMLLFASWMFAGAITVLLTTFMYRALPIGSYMLRGVPMFLLLAGIATAMFWIGVGTLRRQRAAWWAAVAFLIAGMTWGALMMTSMDSKMMSEAMGMEVDAQQEAMSQALYSSPFFYGSIALVWIAYFVFLLYIRRYFFPRSERPAV